MKIIYPDYNNCLIKRFSVIEAVGNGVAVENALDEIKKKAKDITLSNNKDRVEHYIRTKTLRE